MNSELRKEVLRFYTDRREPPSDLATWINDPKRRHERHEFFGIPVGYLINPKGHKFLLKDIGYGGCGVFLEKGMDPTAIDGGAEFFEATIKIADREMEFTLSRRHGRFQVYGFQIIDPNLKQKNFLRSFIQYMEASLAVYQSEASAAFPKFVGEGWLNLASSGSAIRFDLFNDPKQLAANLVFVFEGEHYYCSWEGNGVDVGTLNGEIVGDCLKSAMRKAICILVGIRQAASVPSFAPVIMNLINKFNTV